MILTKTRLTDAQRDEIYELLEKGQRTVDVAYVFGIGNTTVYYIRDAAQAAKNGLEDRLKELYQYASATVDWAKDRFTKTKRVAITNRQWLESLSDDDFYDATNHSYAHTVCPIKQQKNKNGFVCWNISCRDCVIAWLKEPHQEN